MSSTSCGEKLKLISGDDSFSSAREIINKNFESLSACVKSISILASTTQLIFPDNPVNNQTFIITYINGGWVVTPASNDGSGSVYWLLQDEVLQIPARRQHIVSGEFIQELGSNIIIEPTGQLVIL